MSSERGGLLKTRAENFARHLQNRLRSLSDTEDNSWATDVSCSSDNDVYYSIDSSLASPEEEVAEPIFIAAQNRGNQLERSEPCSQYFDSVESFDEPSADSSTASSVQTLKKIPILHLKTTAPTTITNGHVILLDADSGCSRVHEMLPLDLEVETVTGDKDIVKSDHNAECLVPNTRSKNVETFEFGLEAEQCGVCSADIVVVDVSDRPLDDEVQTEPGEQEAYSTDNLVCVFCDIEQIKTSLSMKTTDSDALFEKDISSGNSEVDKPVDLHLKTPLQSEENNNSGCSSDNEESIPLSDLLQVIKQEISKENEQINSALESTDEDKNNLLQTICPCIEVHTTSPETAGEENVTKIDEEFDIETKRKNFRRCSSLRSGKTPPGTPGRKKIVRFADVLGLDLADVKTYLDEVPTIPKSAYEDLHGIDLSSSMEPSISRVTVVVAPQLDKILVPLFQQPGIQPNFLDRVRENNVCLESAYISDMTLFAISGLVRVKNIDFHKSVHVRYSIDNWRSFSDLQARYVSNSCDGFSDKFSFLLYAHTLNIGKRLEFAIRYHTSGAQFWDSNGGDNYKFECTCRGTSRTFVDPSVPPSPIEMWASFY